MGKRSREEEEGGGGGGGIGEGGGGGRTRGRARRKRGGRQEERGLRIRKSRRKMLRRRGDLCKQTVKPEPAAKGTWNAHEATSQGQRTPQPQDCEPQPHESSFNIRRAEGRHQEAPDLINLKPRGGPSQAMQDSGPPGSRKGGTLTRHREAGRDLRSTPPTHTAHNTPLPPIPEDDLKRMHYVLASLAGGSHPDARQVGTRENGRQRGRRRRHHLQSRCPPSQSSPGRLLLRGGVHSVHVGHRRPYMGYPRGPLF